jgi:hypothetical protein
MDSVAGLLDGPRARQAFVLRSSLDPPWSLRIQDEAPLTLVTVVVIHPGQRCTAPDGTALTSMRDLGVRTWGNRQDAETVLLTGTHQLRSEVSRRLLAALPTLLVLTRAHWRTPLTDFLAKEVVRDEPGQEAVLDRLLDLLLVAVLRAWFAPPETAAPGPHGRRLSATPP